MREAVCAHETPLARIAIQDEFDVLSAQRQVRLLARAAGMTADAAAALVTAASELAHNMLVHAGAGELSVYVGPEAGPQQVTVIASDHGPGIADPELALSDGYTTGPGLGLGLSSARRFTDDLRIASTLGQGTMVVVRKWVR